jgi:D-alanyl-lipoteichoic acid acyltransferase DltB (MBOAT superfamily)
VVFVLYPLAAKPILTLVPRQTRIAALAALNVLFLQMLILAQTAENGLTSSGGVLLYLMAAGFAFLTYLTFVLVSYGFLRMSDGGSEIGEWTGFLFPLLILCFVKYWPLKLDPMGGTLVELGGLQRSEFFVGVSYLAFRLSRLLREVRNGAAPRPSLAEYVAFAFYIPTMSIGPINSYSNMQRSLAGTEDESGTTRRAGLRILVGLTKYIFLATLLNQLTYSGLLLDGHRHARLDLLIAIPAYTLYLYCNFSGLCDMVIGISALLGIHVSENFDRPFTARNLQEFWTRWHMTLSSWFRDMMFTPILKWLVRLFGPGSANRMTAATILAVFMILGVWHGNGLNFLIFGLLQGIGVATVHYYRLALKKNLSPQAFATYQKNPGIRIAGSFLTFAYFSLSSFFFANNLEDMRRIAHALV